MSDILTQEEINALLNAGSGGDEPAAPPAAAEPPKPAAGGGAASAQFSQEAIERLSEVAKLSLGATSSVVQILLNQEIQINLEQVRVVSFDELASESGGEEFVLAKIAYVEGFDGNSYLMLKKTISSIIGDLMMGGSGVGAEFQEMHLSAVGEMMNQMMGKTTTTLSEIFKKRVDISPPEVLLINYNDGPPAMPDFSTSAFFLRIGFSLKIGNVAETEMVQLLPAKFAEVMAGELNKPEKEPPKKNKPAPPPPGANLGGQGGGMNMPQQPQGMPGQMPGMPGMGMPGQMPGMPGMGMPGQMPGMGMPGMGMPGQMQGMGMPGMGMPGQMQGMGMPGMGMQGMGMPGMGMPGMGMPGQMQGGPAEFGMLQMPMGVGLQSNIDLLLDVPLQITVELGRTRMLIKDVLELGIGSVVELNKLAGESVEVFVNNKLIAKGEVVVIDENFAVRITSIINPQDRLQAL
ncbi:MAG TPA: flagellar motor switch protein FliN [Candidatus Rifleibacterium sp.]|nr:flagellar motor switch protein FliN [Candidatus Rifleibacterium sp.]HPT47500.1 flagellar motor switch protein FliN [Candidatus Rifleibacterium sp.]